MRRTFNWTPLLSLLAMVALPPAATLGAADKLESADELKKMFTDGQYKDLLPKLNRALTLRGPEADAYPKYDLYCLRGETDLHLKSKQPAMDSFKAAAKEAKKPDDASIASATAELIKESSGQLKYVPKLRVDKDTKPTPIDIVDTTSRKEAFAAMQKDMASKLQPVVDAAVKGNNLPQLASLAKQLQPLKDVEIAGTGAATDSNAMEGDLGTRAKGLLDDIVDKEPDQLNKSIDTLNKTGRDGVTAFFNELKTLDSSNAQVYNAAKSLSDTFGDTIDFKSVQSKADNVHENIVRIRDDVNRKLKG